MINFLFYERILLEIFLRQVQYVFSDKTGTLTENKMLFRRCTVGGQDYSHIGDNENLLPCSRLKEDLLIGTFRHRLQEFLIVLATCNTVVVNSQPHHDIMNSSGVIEEPQKNGTGLIRLVSDNVYIFSGNQIIKNFCVIVFSVGF